MSRSCVVSFDSQLKSGWSLDRNLVHAITRVKAEPPGARAPREDETWCEAVAVERVSAAQLAQLSGVAELELRQMVEYGVLTPVPPLGEPWHFPAHCVPVLRRAQRLREDLAFDGEEFALAMMIIFELERIEAAHRHERATQPGGAGDAPQPPRPGGALT